MKKTAWITVGICAVGLTLFLIFLQVGGDKNLPAMTPSDWFYQQRAYPNTIFSEEEYFEAVGQRDASANRSHATGQWDPVGPYNVGGRITALAVDPVDHDLMYAGAAAGGILKTTDGGVSWVPKTDDFPSLSVGALKLDPGDASVLYCGTGEANTSGDSYAGFGMLKSTDHGESWQLIGLENTRHIAEIEIHPMNPDLVFAAAAGGLYSTDSNRGIYRSLDAGATWEKVLFLNDSTSGIDVTVDPLDTSRVYAAMWERLRGPTFRRVSGINSGIFLSTDGGDNWTLISGTGGLPAPDNFTGRISLAVAPSDPNIVYAVIKTSTSPNGSNNYIDAVYRSTDRGVTWAATNEPNGQSFGWYFGMLEVDPSNPNRLFIGDLSLHRSTNGGASWSSVTSGMHVDQHALWIDPANGNNLVCGNDGGVFASQSGGSPWTKLVDLPVTQFYASTIDFLLPHRKYGGTQDNSTPGTQGGGLDDWIVFYGGDGFFTLVDYTDSDVLYMESQFGGLGRSTDGGQSFTGIDSDFGGDRTNWSTPYVMDLEDNETLYLGTYRVYKTVNRGDNWSVISGDLTRGPNGRLGTITAISVVPDTGGFSRVIYVGTDDAKVSVSLNDGSTWSDVTGVLPDRYVTDILADQRNPAVAYVTLSGYNIDAGNAHVFRTTNFGTDWTDISGDLPDVPINSVIIDYDQDSVLYVGGDVGVFYTTNLGQNWLVLGGGLPNSPVFDLNYHQPTKTLVAATHGRSMFEFDLTVLVDIREARTVIQPARFELQQNYPNPFNPSTTIGYVLNQDAFVTLGIYNVLGQEVRTLISGNQKAGVREVAWDGKTGDGLVAASGVYIFRLSVAGISSSKKMILVR